jgi:hypothetical protein
MEKLLVAAHANANAKIAVRFLLRRFMNRVDFRIANANPWSQASIAAYA